MKTTLSLVALVACLLPTTAAQAQYNDEFKGKNEIRQRAKRDLEGRIVRREDGLAEMEAVGQDRFGNAQGSQYDLAVDGAFEGQTVAVLQFCLEFDFSLPKAALATKGFSTYRWIGKAPTPEELREKLKQACQLWIVSGTTRQLNDEHLKVIKEFFDSGRGLYIWGDNDPYYADANFVGRALLDTTMNGNLPGSHNVGVQSEPTGPGVLANHLLTTGMARVYEGITIATIQPNQQLTPLIYGSAGNLVSAFYDKGGKRAIFDGGFTRLYCGWDTAGTGRYVKNAAAWLVNVERFGGAVVTNTVPTPQAIQTQAPKPQVQQQRTPRIDEVPQRTPRIKIRAPR